MLAALDERETGDVDWMSDAEDVVDVTLATVASVVCDAAPVALADGVDCACL